MKDPTNLYMFAIMPPAELSGKIHDIRLAFAEQFKFVAALKPPVHITLYPPFRLSISEAKIFEQQIPKLQRLADKQAPFLLHLSDYGYFDKEFSPVLYIDVLKSPELGKLHSNFLKELKTYMNPEKKSDPYTPHVTVGYRDTKPEVFPDIKALYSKRTFKASFECDAFYLCKHDRKNWQIFRKYPLHGVDNQLSLF